MISARRSRFVRNNRTGELTRRTCCKKAPAICLLLTEQDATKQIDARYAVQSRSVRSAVAVDLFSWPAARVVAAITDLTRPPRGPTLPLNRRSASDVQDNEGTAEASKKGKEGGEEGEEGRQKGRYVECSTKVSLRHVTALSADAAPEPKSLDATDRFAFCRCRLGRRVPLSAGRTRAQEAPPSDRDGHSDMTRIRVRCSAGPMWRPSRNNAWAGPRRGFLGHSDCRGRCRSLHP